MSRLNHTLRLGLKELTSLRHDRAQRHLRQCLRS